MDQARDSTDSGDSDQENGAAASILTKQNSQQRKLLYRELLNQVENIEERADFGLETVNEVGTILKQVNLVETEHDINERYQYPDETLLDAMVVSSASSALLKCAKSVDINSSTYDASEFADKIKAYISSDEGFKTEDLLKLQNDARHTVPQVPEYLFTYGAYDLNQLPKPKKKEERQKQQKEEYQRKEPEKITNVDKEEPGIDETVKFLYDLLVQCYERNNENPIKYYDFVVDTSSFSNTIENMFYFSFLIRDGKAKLDLDKDGVPLIQPMTKHDLSSFKDQQGVNSQVISSMSYPDWETFKKEGYIQKSKQSKK